MMQRLFFLFIFLSFNCLNAYESKHIPAFNAPDLGKTHFIVGLPCVPPPPPLTTRKNSAFIPALRGPDGSLCQAFFSPDDNLQEILIQLITTEQKSIKAAIFCFTDGDIARALIDAHYRGVHIEIITDTSCLKDKFNKIELLQKYRIPVYVYRPGALTIYNDIMHNKFVVFEKNVDGKSLVWTGSFNFTKSAKLKNQENVIVCDQIHLINRYTKQFAILKDRITKKTAFQNRL